MTEQILLPDGTGVYPITEEYAATCGYSVRVLPLSGHVELRASYFSCHTGNTDDEAFTFNVNLIVTHDDVVLTYTLSKTCSPALPWASRELACEANYMEVSVRSDVACPSGTTREDWDAVVQKAYTSAVSGWQVMFQSAGQELKPMNLTEAQNQGYMFDLTDGRLVFRTPYGQPYAFHTGVTDVPVEVVHATLFSRQSWVVLVVDLVAACSLDEGSYDGGYLMWQTPEALYPLVAGLHETQINVGVNGELVQRPEAEERGYTVATHNGAVQIGIPYNAEGGYRKSVASGDLYEFYVFELYLEQISVDEDDTRVRFHRTLSTPLLPRPVFSEDRTVPEERLFTVYLGDVPLDLELIAVVLKGKEYAVPFTNKIGSTVTEVIHPNDTRGYTMEVPFDDPDVFQQLNKGARAMQHRLDINYTLTVLPEKNLFFHLASVTASTDVSPPEFTSGCLTDGIGFRLDHRPFDYVWEISIGEDPLTSELAAQLGYVMSNDSKTLLLDVPLFSHGFKYTNITLKSFLGTFEILVRDRETSAVQGSSVRTCPFTRTEFIMCSPDGRMTVVADLPLSIPSATSHVKIHLADERCRPKEADGTRVLFSFPLNSCHPTIKLSKENVMYENEIFFSHEQDAGGAPGFSGYTDSVTIKCTYSLAGLHRLFSVYRFESDAAGIGHILHSPQGLQHPTIEPTTVPVTRRTLASTRKSSRLSSAKYIRVSPFLQKLSQRTRG
ncbi:zona pellucida protein AX 4 [Brachionichthys hirsutus]|uniref:zona pellucida protein AX 4 n=1 Tax=Brachionichthys hirsutus TaxID=412623 RepID=UPI0036050AF8